MKIGIVITNHNGLKHLTECLQSIALAAPADMITVVVDNASSDKSVELVRARFPWTTLIECRSNLGFGGGNNLGSRVLLDAGADIIVMLNNDTVISKGFFSNLENALKNKPPSVAIAPKIMKYSSPNEIESAGGHVSLLRGEPIPHHHGQRVAEAPNREVVTQCVSGPAIIVTRALVNQIGLLDESYFLGTEDAEYSLRLIAAGVPIIYVPSVIISHKGHQSGLSRKSGAISTELGSYFCTRNSLMLLSKYGTLSQKIAHAYFILLVMAPWRILQSSIRRQTVFRPMIWALISRVNRSRLPPDDELVEQLLE